MFIVIEVRQWYEEIDTLKAMISVDTQELADAFVVEIKKQKDEKWKEWDNYIQEYVNKIELPETKDNNEWFEFLKQYEFTLGRWITKPHTKEEFKSKYIHYLRDGYGKNIEGFNPPEIDKAWISYYIVEI
jgi:hypothetical protein